jgi:large subunit ribosomal protein L29
MKVDDVRALSREEMQQKLTELKHELFNLRFQKGIGQLENPRKIKQTQKGYRAHPYRAHRDGA